MTTTFHGHTLETFADAHMNTSGNMSFNPNMHSTQAGPSGMGHDYTSSDRDFSFLQSSVPRARDASGRDISGFSMLSTTMAEETAQRTALLAQKLSQKLGPEFLSTRSGPGGSKLTYVEGWKVINLANEVFGHNGWSSSIVSLTTDFVDFDVNRKTFNVGVTAIMRVTLYDGTYHEDLGYGILENSRSKGAALDKCKKEAVTDGLKRALRHFGNVLGNCLYDRSFTAEITKIKAPPPTKLKEEDLHRRTNPNESKPNITPNTSSVQPPAQPNQSNFRPPQPRVAPPRPSAGPSNQSSSRSAPPQPPAPKPETAPPRQVKFEPQTTSTPPAASSSTGTTSGAPAPSALNGFDDDDDDAYDLPGDDALFAAVDLGPAICGEADMGQPLQPDVDMGRPIDHDEGLMSAQAQSGSDPAQNRNPPPPPVGESRRFTPVPQNAAEKEASAAARRDRIAAALAAAAAGTNASGSGSGGQPPASRGPTTATLPPQPINTSTLAQQRYQRYATMRDQNTDPTKTGVVPLAHNESVTYQNNSTAGSSSVTGMKRPADAMMGPPNHRPMRPGMGLQQPHSTAGAPNSRQILGSLDVSESGDIKRVRR